ncbi:MAG: redox-sensing transcriptional repressor Rex [Armatimonadota bacterium]
MLLKKAARKYVLTFVTEIGYYLVVKTLTSELRDTVTDDKRVSRASVLRMELYLDVLEQLQAQGRQHVTSAEIGRSIGVTPENVRQDLFRLGTMGKPKVGYEVGQLAGLIRSIFGLDIPKKACLVGLGNLGKALAGSNIWSKAGFDLVAIFDRDPTVVGTEAAGIRVRSIAEIFGVAKAEGIIAGVVAVPAAAAQETADLMVGAEMKAIWNFAPVRLRVPDGVVVENQSLAWGLITLSQAMKSGSR